MKLLIKLLLPALCCLMAVSCSRDIEEPFVSPNKGEEITVGFTLSIEDEGLGDPSADTRSIIDGEVDEGTETGDLPLNIWMIQYDENGTLVGTPRYIDLSAGVPDNVQVVHSSGATHTLVFVANTHRENMEWGNIQKLESLKDRTKTILGEADCYETISDSEKNLLMSGVREMTIDIGSTINCILYRNIVKLTLEVENDSNSGLELVSVQLFNVPSRMSYADRIHNPEGTAPVELNPQLGSMFYLNYDVEDFVLAPGGGPKSITWYMPRNEMGTAESTLSIQKNNYAPGNATYLRLVAKDENNSATVFTFYPGANMQNDFNLTPNKHYTVSVTIAGKGDPTLDSRIRDYSVVRFDMANSYILNPSPVGTAQCVYSIPVDQLNEFWHRIDQSKEIGVNDKWVATHIWQDVSSPNFIRFVEDDAGNNPATQLVGDGVNSRIRVVTDGTDGNALIGIRKADDSGNPVGDLLWSWHLWVTDYDPTITRTPVNGQYIYTVQNGSVHRYNDISGQSVWTDGGIYADKYIMDRNLGARNSTNHGMEAAGVLLYQFGRKDPFTSWAASLPHVPLYDINGTTINFNNPSGTDLESFIMTNGPVDFATGVMNPTTYYYKTPEQGHGDWASNGTIETLWNAFEAGDTKSIFDPCPPGWRVPVNGCWNDFRYNASQPSNSTVLNAERPEIDTWNYGTNYWPVNTINETGSRIFYPATGRRFITTGIPSSIGNTCISWSATPSTEFYSRSCRFISTAAVNSENNHRGHGLSVRCIQE